MASYVGRGTAPLAVKPGRLPGGSNLRKRGTLAAVNYADVAAFDLDRVATHASLLNPNVTSSGMVHVSVNGSPVTQRAELTAALPGKALRRESTERSTC